MNGLIGAVLPTAGFSPIAAAFISVILQFCLSEEGGGHSPKYNKKNNICN